MPQTSSATVNVAMDDFLSIIRTEVNNQIATSQPPFSPGRIIIIIVIVKPIIVFTKIVTACIDYEKLVASLI